MGIRMIKAVLALPFMVLVVIPFLLHLPDVGWRLFDTLPWWGHALAAVSLALGLALAFLTMRDFATRGQGTPAPWDPPRKLVLTGPYRHVRNPMISSVFCMLLAEALWLHGSLPSLVWGALFVCINLLYIPLREERELRTRFGAAYEEYCRHVPRWIPRLTPYAG